MGTRPTYSRSFGESETAAFSQALVLIHTGHFQVISMGHGNVEIELKLSRKDKVWTVEGGVYKLEEPQEGLRSNKQNSEKILKMPDKEGHV